MTTDGHFALGRAVGDVELVAGDGVPLQRLRPPERGTIAAQVLVASDGRIYAAQQGGGCVEYRVEHPPWRVWDVQRPTLSCDARALYGPAFGEVLDEAPA